MSEPPGASRVKKSMKRRRSPVIRALACLWGTIFLACVLIALIPSWRLEACYRIWTFQNWPVDSSFRGQIVDGGDAAVVLLLEKGGLEHEVIQRALFDLSPKAYETLWSRFENINDPGDIAVFETILANNTHEQIHDSIVDNTAHANASRRVSAIRLAVDAGIDARDEWFTDVDERVRASVLKLRLDRNSVRAYITDTDFVAGELLFQGVHLIDQLSQQRQRKHDLMSLPGFNMEDPYAAKQMSVVQRLIDSHHEKISTISSVVVDNFDRLMRSTSEILLSRTIELLGLMDVESDILLQCEPLLVHQSAEIRRQAMLMMARHGRQSIAETLWQAAFEDKEIIVQLTAWEAMRLLQPRVLRDRLRDFVKKTDRTFIDERQKAFAVLEAMAEAGDRDWFVAMTQGYDPEYARRARTVLRRLDRGE